MGEAEGNCPHAHHLTPPNDNNTNKYITEFDDENANVIIARKKSVLPS